MYTVPPQDIYAQDWMDQLMVHEFRHAAQYAAVDRGFTRVLSLIFGQQALPAMIGLFAPFWFIEGDATVIETATGSNPSLVACFSVKPVIDMVNPKYLVTADPKIPSKQSSPPHKLIAAQRPSLFAVEPSGTQVGV